MPRLSSASPRCLLLLRCKPMAGNGWIKLHRKLLESLIFGNEKGLKVWVWCLLKANHADKQVLLGRRKITLKAGQFIMGSTTAKEQLSLAKATIWYWLNFLEKEGQVRLEKTTKYTIVTIPKWEEYQHELDTNETQSERKVGTNKNDKNDKNLGVAYAPPVREVPDNNPELEREGKISTRVIPLPYSVEATRAAWADGERRLQVLEWYLDAKGLWKVATTREKLKAIMYRHGQSAVRIADAGWTKGEMNKAKSMILENEKLATEWTLDTLEKYLTKIA